MASDFYARVYELVRSIPAGRVTTYGQVATLLGRPRSARLVGWALNNCPADVPWQRVINREGMISIENFRATKDLQAKLLQTESVEVVFKNGNYWVDLARYQWHPTT